MTNRLVGRETVKRAGGITGTSADALIDRLIDGASARVCEDTGERFIPVTETRYYDWPQPEIPVSSYRLYLDAALQSVSALKTEGGATMISADDYFLRPDDGPPHHRIEIDRSSSAILAAGDTSQRAVQVTGDWSRSADTEAAGTVASGLADSAEATTCVCSDSSLIDVGHTLLIESERLFVTGRGLSDTTANLASNIAANKAVTTVPVNDGSLVKQGEVITIDSERMLVEDVAGNNLVVQRGYDGSTLAAHTSSADVYAPRSLTVERGVNGTTAATHADATAIAVYVPPQEVVDLVIAEVLSGYAQQQSRYGREIGPNGGTSVVNRRELAALEDAVMRIHMRRDPWTGV